jgi:broad specificity phosphatase PhoE
MPRGPRTPALRPSLWLVRHAMPAHGPEIPAAGWELSEQGRQAAESIRGVLPGDALLVSSTEPKARQTLEPCGDVRTDDRFNEVWRDEAYRDDFRAARRVYVSGAEHPGWEKRAAVVARFDAGVRHWRALAGARPLAIASHGMAMTLWLSATVNVADPGRFWAGLRFPDVIEVDPDTACARRAEARWSFQLP